MTAQKAAKKFNRMKPQLEDTGTAPALPPDEGTDQLQEDYAILKEEYADLQEKLVSVYERYIALLESKGVEVRKTITNTDLENMVKLRKRGLSYKAIGIELGRTKQVVYYALHNRPMGPGGVA